MNEHSVRIKMKYKASLDQPIEMLYSTSRHPEAISKQIAINNFRPSEDVIIPRRLFHYAVILSFYTRVRIYDTPGPFVR